MRTTGSLARLGLHALLAGAALAAPAAAPTSAQILRPGAAAASIERIVAAPEAVPRVGRLRSPTETRAFYAARQYRSAWTAGGAPTAAAVELSAVVRAAATHGLDPARYHVSAIGALLDAAATPTDERMASLDAALTDAFLTLAADRARGRVDPARLHPRWSGRPPAIDAAALLGRTLAIAGSPAAALDALDPTSPEYAQLRAGLARYRAVADAGGWPAVAAARTLRAGDAGRDVAALEARLAAEPGARAAGAETRFAVRSVAPAAAAGRGPMGALAFDDRIEQAVRDFQRRHDLVVDGIVGPRTLAALNVTARARAEQIELAMERLRWLPRELPATRIVVMMPAFQLEAVRAGEPPLRMRVVAGRPDWPTPVMIDAVERISFRPYWNVPARIAATEVLPAVRRDPRYLARNALEVRVRADGASRVVDPATIDWAAVRAGDARISFHQRPGPANPLGLIKFVMPNPDAIALHDTPSRGAFERSSRAVSHGCVRLEAAAELAEWLLGPQGWNADAVRAAMNAERSSTAELRTPVPVFLLYRTAWIGSDHELRLGADPYGRDAVLATALRAAAAQADRAGAAGPSGERSCPELDGRD